MLWWFLDVKSISIHPSMSRNSTRASNAKLLDLAVSLCENETPRNLPVATVGPLQKVSVDSLQMPPPAAPLSAAASMEDTSFARPQRAAKLKSERNLKEPSLVRKIRRPSNFGEEKIKLEHEQRHSQMHNASQTSTKSKSSTVSAHSEDSVCILASSNAVVDLESEDEPLDQNDQQKKSRLPFSITLLLFSLRK